MERKIPKPLSNGKSVTFVYISKIHLRVLQQNRGLQSLSQSLKTYMLHLQILKYKCYIFLALKKLSSCGRDLTRGFCTAKPV